MKIESIIKRTNGHTVELDGKAYEFLPPDYLAEVENPDHIGRLLSITEGYRAVGAGAKAQPLKPVAPAALVDYLLSELHPAAFEIGGKAYEQIEVVKLAAGDRTAEAWNALGDGERADLIDEQLDKLEEDGANAAEAAAAAAAELEQLKAAYKDRTGKLPHHKWSAEKIKAELAKPEAEV